MPGATGGGREKPTDAAGPELGDGRKIGGRKMEGRRGGGRLVHSEVVSDGQCAVSGVSATGARHSCRFRVERSRLVRTRCDGRTLKRRKRRAPTAFRPRHFGCDGLTQSAPPSPCRCRSRRSRCRSRRGAGGRPRGRHADTRSSCFPNLCPGARAPDFLPACRGAR